MVYFIQMIKRDSWVCHSDEGGITSNWAKSKHKYKMIEYNEGYHTYYVYIITNKYKTTYYVGMTNNLRQRLQQHSENIKEGIKTFASKYNIEFLVYYEKFTWVQQAISREKEIKGWRREKKLDLIRSFNKNFDFLNHYFAIACEIPPSSE